MKRLLTANKQTTGKARYHHDKMEIMLKAQIDNCLEVGWQPRDIILLTNFDFEFMGIKSEVIELNNFCLSGSKMWAIKYLFDNNRVNDTIYAGDLDCWQTTWFDCPTFEGDVGACCYSNPKFNGGSIFWKPESKDIVYKVVEILTAEKAKSEEPTLNRIFKSNEYKDRVSVLNSSYNVGCSGFFERYDRGIKPIKVCHFHPQNNVAWEIHCLDRDGMGVVSLTVRLERLIRKYYPERAVQLKDKMVPYKKRAEREARRKKREKKKEKAD